MASRRFAVIAVCATIVALGAAASWVIPDVRSRVKLTALKLGGSLDGLSWGELAQVMDPRGPYRLAPLVESQPELKPFLDSLRDGSRGLAR